MAILIFFLAHWFLSLFCQTFFLHRYASHKMFTMSKFWERFFYGFTIIVQGSSFLNPRAYAIMHRMHHAYSDTEKDPHSPHFFKDVWHMTMHTKDIYLNYAKYKTQPEKAFQGNYPEWPLMDKISDMWSVRILFGIGYFLFYWFFATEWWMFLLLPIHFFMGPVHGAIVNWCGHKYGYSNYENHDHSKNSLPLDFLLMGELMQNNHHKSPNSVNFAKKWFEFDPTYPVVLVLNKLRVIRLRRE
ncbi:acyl-CoA desaturase [Niabella ginsengisoli]|uniref:Acyl-CoA desaturase n=1 Tax=Niabella ginsengisoli TaxID=522298 RepID=A0ABS9SNU9_9BACT|nr:acyl-CoA desaturase [Niabella ginsengisoli]MCH5600046.1 acyl-CoA desaturase [Niabella ginsengisoli]